MPKCRERSAVLPRSARVLPRATTCIATFALACVLPVTVLDAQTATVRGTVRHAAGFPMEGAQVSIAGTATMVTSNERGEFTLTLPSASPDAPLVLRVRRIGFRPDSLVLPPGGPRSGDLTFTLQRVAVDLAPVTVVGRRDISGAMAGFYKRRASSSGRFFTREEIERRNAARMSDLLRMVPSLRVIPRGMQNSVRIRGSRCAPLIWLDGVPLSAMEFDLDSMDPSTYEGIEVYSGPASVPVEFQQNKQASSSCGTIVLWSRRGSVRAAKLNKRDDAAAQKVAEMVERSVVFLEHQVDVAARLDSSLIVRPIYPDAMFDGGTPGQVLVEFVVGSTGEAVLETFNIIIASDRAFVEPVRRAVKDQRFFPATKGGKPVQQVMQVPFKFVPDSTARRKR